MKIPTIVEARELWNVTKIEVSQYDQSIDSMRVILQQKYLNILNDIKTNNYIIGLKQYDLNVDETYAIHIMLILNDNIMLQEENSYAKYTYVNENMKASLGIKAYGLYWLSDDISQYIYKRYKMIDENIYRNICFILNSLIGYAYQHKSSISNQNIFNLYFFAKKLFMSLDQFLIALSILKLYKIIDCQLIDHEFNYKFKFCDYISNYIENQLIQAKQQINENTEKNEIKERLFINVSDNNIDILPYINYVKKHNNNDYILLSFADVKDNLTKAKLKNLICHYSHIIFQPHNFDSDKKVLYAYQYIDDVSKKFDNFSDYCIFRFIPQRFVKVLSFLWVKYGIQVDFINTMLMLDTCFKKLDYVNYIKFNSNIFKLLGMTDYGDFINIINVLISTQLIDVINLRVANKMLSFHVRLKNDYSSLKYNELYDVLDSNISQSVKQIRQFNFNTNTNTNTNIDIDTNINANTDTNIDVDTAIDTNMDVDTDADTVINTDTDINTNVIDINIANCENETKEIDINTDKDDVDLTLIKTNKKEEVDIQEQNKKLIVDNSYLLSQLTELRNFNNKDLNKIKNDISISIAVLINNITKELNVYNNDQLLLSQKNIIKMIFDLEEQINKSLS